MTAGAGRGKELSIGDTSIHGLIETPDAQEGQAKAAMTV